MLPAVRGILPRTQPALPRAIKIVIVCVTKSLSGNMPDGASRMLALPESTRLHERDDRSHFLRVTSTERPNARRLLPRLAWGSRFVVLSCFCAR